MKTSPLFFHRLTAPPPHLLTALPPLQSVMRVGQLRSEAWVWTILSTIGITIFMTYLVLLAGVAANEAQGEIPHRVSSARRLATSPPKA